jgi:hypothetical protein
MAARTQALLQHQQPLEAQQRQLQQQQQVVATWR